MLRNAAKALHVVSKHKGKGKEYQNNWTPIPALPDLRPKTPPEKPRLPDRISHALPTELAQLSQLYLQMSSCGVPHSTDLALSIHRSITPSWSADDMLENLSPSTLQLFARLSIRKDPSIHATASKIKEVLVSLGLKHYHTARRKADRTLKTLMQIALADLGHPRHPDADHWLAQAKQLYARLSQDTPLANRAPLIKALHARADRQALLHVYASLSVPTLQQLLGQYGGLKKVTGLLAHHYRETYPDLDPHLLLLFSKLKNLPANDPGLGLTTKEQFLVYAFLNQARDPTSGDILHEAFHNASAEESLATFLLCHFAVLHDRLRPKDVALIEALLSRCRPSVWSSLMLLRITRVHKLDHGLSQRIQVWVWDQGCLDKRSLAMFIQIADEEVLWSVHDALMAGSPATRTLLATASLQRGLIDLAWSALKQSSKMASPPLLQLRLLATFVDHLAKIAAANEDLTRREFRMATHVAVSAVLIMRQATHPLIRRQASQLLRQLILTLIRAHRMIAATRIARYIPPRLQGPLALRLTFSSPQSLKAELAWSSFIRHPPPLRAKQMRTLYSVRLAAYACPPSVNRISTTQVLRVWHRIKRSQTKLTPWLVTNFAAALVHRGRYTLAERMLRREGLNAAAVLKEARARRRRANRYKAKLA